MTNPKPAREAAYAAVDALTAWTEWAPFTEAALTAPRKPGVYMVRVNGSDIVYVGKSEGRPGSGSSGLRGRLAVYRGGKGSTSGFGEAAFDRALADQEFLMARAAEVEAGQPRTARQWAVAAIERVSPELSWAVCLTGAEAAALEAEVWRTLIEHGLWNKPPRVAVERVKPQQT